MALQELLAEARRRREQQPDSGSPETVAPRGRSKPVFTDCVEPSLDELARVEGDLASEPGNPFLMSYLASLYYAARRYQAAAALHQALLDRGHEPALQHFHLGNCLFRLGRRDAARLAWQLCLQEGPSDLVGEKVARRLGEL